MNKEQFAGKTIRLCRKRGCTQAQLAELLNVSNKTVSRWGTAEGYPGITLLKPLSEALGIGYDELLGDTKGYSDSPRYDLQCCLPYNLTLLALLLYHMFLKLQISQPLSFTVFLGMMVFNNVSMIRHMDKRALPPLAHWNLLLAYFPLVSFLQYLYILYLFSQLGFSNTLEALAMQTEEFHSYSFLVSGYETGVTIYPLIHMVALLVLTIVYGCLRHTFVARYDISWNGLHKGVHEKGQEEKNILFRKWSDGGETVLRIVMPLIAGLTLLVFGILLFQEYRSLIIQSCNSIPPNFFGNDYILTVSNEALGACREKLFLLLCDSCLSQLLAIMKSKGMLYYISNVSVLLLCGAIILLFTTIMDRFYIRPLFAFVIPAGIGMIMWHCRDILQKKGKRGVEDKKTQKSIILSGYSLVVAQK